MKIARLGHVLRGELYLQHTNTGYNSAPKLSEYPPFIKGVEFVFLFDSAYLPLGHQANAQLNQSNKPPPNLISLAANQLWPR